MWAERIATVCDRVLDRPAPAADRAVMLVG